MSVQGNMVAASARASQGARGDTKHAVQLSHSLVLTHSYIRAGHRHAHTPAIAHTRAHTSKRTNAQSYHPHAITADMQTTHTHQHTHKHHHARTPAHAQSSHAITADMHSCTLHGNRMLRARRLDMKGHARHLFLARIVEIDGQRGSSSKVRGRAR